MVGAGLEALLRSKRLISLVEVIPVFLNKLQLWLLVRTAVACLIF